jgi:hypothetical protein
MPDIVFVVGLLILLPFFFIAALAYDRLACRLHDLYPEEWRAAGRPVGFFWRPSEGPLYGSPIAFVKASLGWAFRLPAALATDPPSKRDQARYRICLVVWNAGVLILLTLEVWVGTD